MFWEMFGFDEWVSRATLSMFRFMPTLGLLPLLKVPLNRQDAKSRQISRKKRLQSNYGQRIVHENDSSASRFFYYHVWVAVVWL